MGCTRVLASAAVTGTTLRFALVLATAAALWACGATVGDACEVDADCGQRLVCEHTLPGGYCTLSDCALRGCPEEGVCIHFDAHTSYCMRPCDTGDACRDEYLCVGDFGPHGFCSAVEAPGES